MPDLSYNASGYATTTNTAFTPIMATSYIEQSANAQRSLVSSDAADTAAGTGARTVRITYYDQTLMGPFTEDVVLNGTTPVDTVNNNICFIESLEVLTVGVQLGNVGTISLKAVAAGGGVTVGSIAPSDNRTQWAHHYIPQNKAILISYLFGGIYGSTLGEVHMCRSTPTVANTPEQTIAPVMFVPPGDQRQTQFTSPVVVLGPSRVLLYARSRAAVTQDWQASFGFTNA